MKTSKHVAGLRRETQHSHTSQNLAMHCRMRTYKRFRVPGGCYFFTVNLAERQHNDLLIRHVNDLRAAFGQVRSYHPFTIDAIVILPEHLHCIWQLPPNDHDYSTRWRLIKSHFSRSIPDAEFLSRSRLRKQERGIWQSFRSCLRPLPTSM